VLGRANLMATDKSSLAKTVSCFFHSQCMSKGLY
jgi:hypothetical protein